MNDRADGGNRGPRRMPPRGPAGRSGPRPKGAPGRPAAAPIPRRGGGLNLRLLGGDQYELIHPGCVEEMRPDYEEGLEIWKAGEAEEARDALRFALQGCGDNIWVHVALGKIALESFNDPTLARGHFGYGFELARKALPADFTGKLPRHRPANRPFYEALEGLIACDRALGNMDDAARLNQMLKNLAG